MGGDDLAHGFLIEVDSLQRLIVIAVERHITENERLVMNRIFGFGEVEVPAVVQEAVIIRVGVLPSPILAGQLAVGAVLLGDGIALIIMQQIGIREAARAAPT